MHIGIFTNIYFPYRSGVSTSIDGFRTGLLASGHDVSIFAQQWEKTGSEPAERIYRYPSVEAPTKIPYAVPVPYSPEIDDVIRGTEYDIIHAQHPYLVGALGKKWAYKKNVPLVFTWHSLYEKYIHYASFVPQQMMKKWVLATAMDFAREAHHVIVPTQSIYDLLADQDLPEKKMSIVPSGVDEQLFDNPDPTSLRTQYKLRDDQKVILCICRHTREKNVLFLARSVRKVLDEDRNAVFIFGGAGNLTDDLKSYFCDAGQEDRVIFPGRIPRDQKKNYYALADLFVYASTSETQGMTPTEAMYMGVPVVAVRASGITDIVHDGETGVLVGESSNDFAYVVRTLLSDDKERARLAKNAKKIAAKELTVTACTKKLLAVYERVIEDYQSHKS